MEISGYHTWGSMDGRTLGELKFFFQKTTFWKCYVPTSGWSWKDSVHRILSQGDGTPTLKASLHPQLLSCVDSYVGSR